MQTACTLQTEATPAIPARLDSAEDCLVIREEGQGQTVRETGYRVKGFNRIKIQVCERTQSGLRREK